MSQPPYQPYYPMPPQKPQPSFEQQFKAFMMLLRRRPLLILPLAILALVLCAFVGSAAVSGVIQGIQENQPQAQANNPTATTAQAQVIAATTQVATPEKTVIPTVKPTAKLAIVPTSKPTPKPIPTQPPAPTPTPCTSPCNPWGYSFSPGSYIYSPNADFCSYFNCIASFWNGHGFVNECQDGTYSKSGGIRGDCSDHGGELRPLYAH